MTWRAEAHKGFWRDLDRLGDQSGQRVRRGIRRLLDALDHANRLEPRRTFTSNPILAGIDLRPLRASGVPGSYRLRIGAFRVGLVVLPDEHIVLLTVAARRTDSTYKLFPETHRHRFLDR